MNGFEMGCGVLPHPWIRRRTLRLSGSTRGDGVNDGWLSCVPPRLPWS